MAATLIASALWVLAYRWVDPPTTPTRLAAGWSGEPVRVRWMPLDRLAPSLVLSVLASEDMDFCRHHGFDWNSIDDALARARAGLRLTGASTLSQQTARTLFLWQGRSWLRKGLEAWFTVLLETLLPKQRILELYLNSAEWGAGLYGAGAATAVYFGDGANPGALSVPQAAFLTVLLPSPRRLARGLSDEARLRQIGIETYLGMPEALTLAACLPRATH